MYTLLRLCKPLNTGNIVIVEKMAIVDRSRGGSGRATKEAERHCVHGCSRWALARTGHCRCARALCCGRVACSGRVSSIVFKTRSDERRPSVTFMILSASRLSARISAEHPHSIPPTLNSHHKPQTLTRRFALPIYFRAPSSPSPSGAKSRGAKRR